MKRFEEKIKTYPIINFVIALSLAIIAYVFLQAWNDQFSPLYIKIILLAVIVLEILVFLNFRELTVSVENNQLILAFGVFRKKIWIGEIAKIEESEYQFRNYNGYGIRFGRDKTIGYVPCGGKGLKIFFKNSKKQIFFITKRAEELKQMLSK
ncbi:MAG: hypothetical protein WCT18_01710 [Patescibacteria group bacterium]